MTGEQTEKVVKRIKEIIHGDGKVKPNGFCRVGFAISDVLKTRNPRLTDITKVTAYLINTGEYTMYPSKYDEKDVDIFPVNKLDLFHKKSTRQTYWVLFIIAFISSALSIFKFVQDQFQKEETKQLLQRIELLELEQSKLRTYILTQKNPDSLTVPSFQSKK